MDDEPLALEVLKRYAAAMPALEIVAVCNNAFDALDKIQSLHPDLVFLDIQMPKLSGIELVELLESPLPRIVFTTAFEQFAVKAFELHAIDYLLKPFSKERFQQAITNFNKFHPEQTQSSLQGFIQDGVARPTPLKNIVVKSGNNVHILPVQDIVYFEAYDDYVKIITAADLFLKKKTMAFFERELEADQFVRIHRSIIVNIGQVSKLMGTADENLQLVLRDGRALPVSRTGYQRLKGLLGI